MLVACRDNASASSSRAMPQPSSVTRIEARAAVFDVDGDRARPRVERILDELFDDGRRPLHDLAGRDLIDELGRQDANRH